MQSISGAIVFAVVSLLLVLLSRASLLRPRSHGFYRFFAWEAILALVILNVGEWFRDPFSIHQFVSWLLLIVSAFLVSAGTSSLRASGGHDRGRDDEGLLALEKTATLVSSGIFRFIRHPLYSSLFFLAWGTFFKDPGWVGGILGAAATYFLYKTAKADEAECVRYFGADYEAYMTGTKMFVPYVF